MSHFVSGFRLSISGLHHKIRNFTYKLRKNLEVVPHHVADIDLAADEFLSDNPHRGGYHGMRVSGA